MSDEEEKKLHYAVMKLIGGDFDTRKIILKLAEVLKAKKNLDDDKWAEKLHDIATVGIS